MNASQEMRKLLEERPSLTAEEMAEALHWSVDQARRTLGWLLTEGQIESLPKRYSLTQAGAMVTRLCKESQTTAEQKKVARERQRAYRESQRAIKQVKPVKRVEIPVDHAAINETMVQRAKESQHPLAAAWSAHA